MQAKFKTFEELTSTAANFLKNKLFRSEGTARHYHILWRRVKKYMGSQKIKYFDAAVGKQFLLKAFGDRDYSLLSKREKDLVKAVSILGEFYKTGSIQPVKEQPIFDGSIGKLMVKYLSYRTSLRLKKHTVEQGAQHLYRFLCYLHNIKVGTVKEINHLHILQFIKTLNPKFSTLTHLTLQSIRAFFKYAYEQKLLDNDLSAIVPKSNFRKQPKLPSTYSVAEIEKLIASIDRGDAKGKRNYAIVLLAARLGLRASDIANLTFESLLWEKSMIVLNQFKTGKKIELPILPEIGNAIIDYLKFGRPKSKESFVFLLSRSPFNPISNCSITGIVHSYFVKSGINITCRKHGPHALRHSLAGILLEKETILPVISEVLGHKSTASTNYYLRIDLTSMRQCALEVPLVSTSFYQQKGGYFYA
jgi:site-specific recombinase XerD